MKQISFIQTLMQLNLLIFDRSAHIAGSTVCCWCIVWYSAKFNTEYIRSTKITQTDTKKQNTCCCCSKSWPLSCFYPERACTCRTSCSSWSDCSAARISVGTWKERCWEQTLHTFFKLKYIKSLTNAFMVSFEFNFLLLFI